MHRHYANIGPRANPCSHTEPACHTGGKPYSYTHRPPSNIAYANTHRRSTGGANAFAGINARRIADSPAYGD